MRRQLEILRGTVAMVFPGDKKVLKAFDKAARRAMKGR